MKRLHLAACASSAVLALFITSCSQPQPAPDTRVADETALRSAEAAWSKAAGAKDLNATVAFYADDGPLLAPNAPIASGKEAVRKTWEQLLAMPGLSISWQASK